MKNFKSILSLLFLTITIICNAQQLTSKTYNNLGKIHNQALDNFLKNFKEQKISNLDDGVDYINSIHSNFYNLLTVSNEDKSNLVESSKKFRYFVVENSFYDYLYYSSNSYSKLTNKAKESIDKVNNEVNISSQYPALSQIIFLTNQNGLIDNFEKDKLFEINNLVSENKAGRITITELKEEMNKIAIDFDSKKYDFNGKNGHLLAQTLSIGLNSIEWWITNGDFRVMYENDGSIGPLGDGGDSYRTAALNLSIGDYTAGFNLMTGKRDYKGEESLDGGHRGNPEIDKFNRRMPNGYALEKGNKYRLGALTVGYKGYRVGVNSEHVRHAIQDQAIHNLRIPWFNGKSLLDKRQRGFENQSWDWKGYFQYRTPNQFTSW